MTACGMYVGVESPIISGLNLLFLLWHVVDHCECVPGLCSFKV